MIRIPPPFLALSAALAQRALTGTVERPTAARASAATAAGVASLALVGGSARLFRRSGTTFDPFDPVRASVLVTTGANSITRNPMYVGMAGLLVSNAILRGSWTALAPVVGFTMVIDRLQIASEEPALIARFGADYEEYRAAVPRWLDRRSVGWRSAGSVNGPGAWPG